MAEALIQRLNQIVALNQEEKQFLRKKIPVKSFQKDEFLLVEGQISTAFYFLIKGCVRLFYLNEGQEKTAFFYSENQFISSYESFVKQLPSKQYFQAVEPIEVAIISQENALNLLAQFPKFEALSRICMEEELMVCQSIIASFVALNSEQRYLNLLKTQPELLQRIPQYHIATYLGVTPETLSRIRKRIVKKNIRLITL